MHATATKNGAVAPFSGIRERCRTDWRRNSDAPYAL